MANQSRDKSVEDSNVSQISQLSQISHTMPDGTTEHRVVRVNCLKRANKPNVSLGKEQRKENEDKENLNYGIGRELNGKEEVAKQMNENKALREMLAALQKQQAEMQEELAKTKGLLGNSNTEVGRLRKTVKELESENTSLKE